MMVPQTGIASSKFKSPVLVSSDEAESRGLLSLRDSMPTYMKELVAGGVAGGFAKTVVAPLERVKILYQTRHGNFQSLGVFRSLRYILNTEGVRGFYKGNGASVVRVVPYAALHFMTYEQYREWIIGICPWPYPGPAVDLFAGSMAGGTAVLLTYPLDLARTKLAYQVNGISSGKLNSAFQPVAFPQSYRGIADVFSQVYRESGLRGLYRGVGPTLYGMLPYAGMKFYMYEKLKALIPDEHCNSVSGKLVCGAVAGMVGQTLTYPLDVVRRQMQVQTVSGTGGPHYRTTLDGLRAIICTQGWRQIFAGLTINYLKLAPSVAIGFAAYDGMKSWLRVPPRCARDRKKLKSA